MNENVGFDTIGKLKAQKMSTHRKQQDHLRRAPEGCEDHIGPAYPTTPAKLQHFPPFEPIILPR